MPADAQPREDSLYEAVMADPEARHAYLHTTKGILTGRGDDPDTLSVKASLDEARIAYLYNPDPLRARPMFLMTGQIAVGREQIEAVIPTLRSSAAA